MKTPPEQTVPLDIIPGEMQLDEAELEAIELELETSPLLLLAFREALKPDKFNLDKAKVFKDIAVARCTIDKTKKELGIIGNTEEPKWLGQFNMEVPRA